MTTNDILIDGFEHVKQVTHKVVNGLDEASLTRRAEGTGNSIAWLIWHLTHIQDDHLADLREHAQVWTANGWYDKFGLALDASDTGYGHTASEVANVKADVDMLLGYYDAVHAETIDFIRTLNEKDYDRIVDENWDPPVTMAVRLVSVLSDDLQHAGQAAYARGLI